MSYKKSSKISEEFLNKIISVAYKDAKIFDKAVVYYLAFRNSEIKKLLNDFKKTAAEVQT